MCISILNLNLVAVVLDGVAKSDHTRQAYSIGHRWDFV